MSLFGFVRPPALVRAAVFVVLSVVLLALVVSARAATLVSETTWGGAGSEGTNGVAAASDGSTYLTGGTTSFDPFGQFQLYLVKHTPDGAIAWQRTWEGAQQFGNDEGQDVGVAPDGSVYVLGTAFGDALLLKFAPDGTLLWQRRWDSGGTDTATALAVAANGSIYATGGTSASNAVFVLRFAPEGTLTWQRFFGPASSDGIALAPDGSVYVAGTAARPGGAFAFDVVLLKLDSSGSLVWRRAYSAAEITDARAGVTVAPDGSIYVGGTIQDATQKLVVDALIVKFAPDGTALWDRGWGGRSGDTGGGVAALPDGSVVLVGATNSFGAGIDDAFVLHLSPQGRGIDSSTWGGAQIENGNDVVIASDGTIVLGGVAQAPPYVFDRASSRAYRMRGTATEATVSEVAGTGTLADAGGTVAEAVGTTPGSGGTDAAVVRIVP